MRVIVGFEASGVVRRAFREMGHEAWSCDLLPAEDGSEFHLQCDIWDAINQGGWDLGIFHPPCTYLTRASWWALGDGPYHQKVKPDTPVGERRRVLAEEALKLVRKLMALQFRTCIENPRGLISVKIRPYDQIVQPWWFGHDEKKELCLWLNGLPKLKATNYIAPRIINGRPRWSNQTNSGQNVLSPTETRWFERSRTCSGLAKAMASQWGSLLWQNH